MSEEAVIAQKQPYAVDVEAGEAYYCFHQNRVLRLQVVPLRAQQDPALLRRFAPGYGL